MSLKICCVYIRICGCACVIINHILCFKFFQPQTSNADSPATTTAAAVKPKHLPNPLFDDDDDELDWLT